MAGSLPNRTFLANSVTVSHAPKVAKLSVAEVAKTFECASLPSKFEILGEFRYGELLITTNLFFRPRPLRGACSGRGLPIGEYALWSPLILLPLP